MFPICIADRAAEKLKASLAFRTPCALHCACRLAEAGIEPSVGSVDDSDDNAPVERINRLFKTKVIDRRGSRRPFQGAAFATLARAE